MSCTGFSTSSSKQRLFSFDLIPVSSTLNQQVIVKSSDTNFELKVEIYDFVCQSQYLDDSIFSFYHVNFGYSYQNFVYLYKTALLFLQRQSLLTSQHSFALFSQFEKCNNDIRIVINFSWFVFQYQLCLFLFLRTTFASSFI